MRAADLTSMEHAVFTFIEPTAIRINNSIAWKARCKHCGKLQLVGAAQVRSGQHARCIECMIPKEIQSRDLVI